MNNNFLKDDFFRYGLETEEWKKIGINKLSDLITGAKIEGVEFVYCGKNATSILFHLKLKNNKKITVAVESFDKDSDEKNNLYLYYIADKK